MKIIFCFASCGFSEKCYLGVVWCWAWDAEWCGRRGWCHMLVCILLKFLGDVLRLRLAIQPEGYMSKSPKSKSAMPKSPLSKSPKSKSPKLKNKKNSSENNFLYLLELKVVRNSKTDNLVVDA